MASRFFSGGYQFPGLDFGQHLKERRDRRFRSIFQMGGNALLPQLHKLGAVFGLLAVPVMD
jgi:hypothetical protein